MFTGPPVAWMLPAPMLLSASSAAATCAAVELNASGAVVWPLNVSVNVPPVAFVTRTVWFSSVFWSMLWPQLPASPLPAALSSPVGEPEVVVLVEVDVAGDVAAGAAVVRDAEDLLLAREVEVRRVAAARRRRT